MIDLFDMKLARSVCVWVFGSAFLAVGCGGSQSATAPLSPPVASTAPRASASSEANHAPPKHRPKVIVFVWDGLRPDSVSPETTPNLARLRDREGVNFEDHHSVYPTFTMMNAAALATGAYPSHHGFFGNIEYLPGASGTSADGRPLDFSQPIFTEDHGVLLALDAFHRAHGKSGLFTTETLFQAAHKAGLRTAAIGKIGPAFMQDFRPSETLSAVLDENIAVPFAFARALQTAGFPLPMNTVEYPYPNAQRLTLAADNGKPTAIVNEKLVRLKDGVTSDPRSTIGSAYDAANEYLIRAYLEYVLPKFDPDLSFVWLRNPDSTEHQFGPGSPNHLDALRNQDALLGQLEGKLKTLGLAESTDLIVVSDHGHSTVAGDRWIFPLRALSGEPDGHGEVSTLDSHGYSVSGELRTADWLTRVGFTHVYDGSDCLLDPVLSGERKDGSFVYPIKKDANGGCVPEAVPIIGANVKPEPRPYSFPGFHLPERLPSDAIVIAPNGGSEYFYLPSHDPKRMRALVQALAEHVAYGAMFVSARYGALAGTLPLSAIHAESDVPGAPDAIVSFAWNEDETAGGTSGLPGTEYASAQRYRGMHGSFSPRDTHNTLIAAGPSFKVGYRSELPSGNVDVAPTVAALLGIPFIAPDGRALNEALRGHDTKYTVTTGELAAREPMIIKRSCNPDDPKCAHPGGNAAYRMVLKQKLLTDETTHASYGYLERATVTRKSTSPD